MFISNSETCLENHETSERKAGVGSNGGLCKEPVVIFSVYPNIKPTLMFPTKKHNLLFSKTIKESEKHLAFEMVSTIPCLSFAKCLKVNLNKIKISLLTVSKFKHDILLIICNCSKES